MIGLFLGTWLVFAVGYHVGRWRERQARPRFPFPGFGIGPEVPVVLGQHWELYAVGFVQITEVHPSGEGWIAYSVDGDTRTGGADTHDFRKLARPLPLPGQIPSDEPLPDGVIRFPGTP